MHPDLQHLQDQYHALLEACNNGQLSYDDALAQASGLSVTDSQGWTWAIDPNTGNFYRFNAVSPSEFVDVSLYAGGYGDVGAGVAGVAGVAGAVGGDLADQMFSSMPGVGVPGPQEAKNAKSPKAKKPAKAKAPKEPTGPKRKFSVSTILIALGALVLLGALATTLSHKNHAGTTSTLPVVTTTIPVVTTLPATTTTQPVTTTTRPVTTTTRPVVSTTTTPLLVPGAPRAVQAIAGVGNATVRFAAGGGQASYFVVTAVPDGQSCTTYAHACVVRGLRAKVSYRFSVRAHNNAGWSTASTSNSVVVLSPPPVVHLAAAVTNVRVVPGVGQITVSFAPGAVDATHSAAASYVVTVSPGNKSCTTTTTSCVVSGLVAGKTYVISVMAKNAAGLSAATKASLTLVSVPGAPSNVVASVVAKSATANITWAAPASDGGSAITQYKVTDGSGNTVCTTAATSCATSALNFGVSYTFSVVATNAQGTSAPSTSSNAVTPYTVPAAPSAPTVVRVAGATSATVSWVAPNDEGSAITSYSVSSTPAGKGCVTTTTTTCVVTGLSSAVSYRFSVTATNAAGASAASSFNLTAPGAPTGVVATGGVGKIVVTWHAPADNGGSAVIHYVVSVSPGAHGCTATTTSCTLGIAAAGTYSVSVVAVNAVGTSPSSGVARAVVRAAVTTTTTPAKTAPSAPSGLGTSGHQAISLSWYAPASDGGSAVTKYTVWSKATAGPHASGPSQSARIIWSGTATHMTTIKLDQGYTMTFWVTASNAVGTSPSSSVVNVLTGSTPGAISPAYFAQSNGFLAVAGGLSANYGGWSPTSLNLTLTEASYLNGATKANWSCRFLTSKGKSVPVSFYCQATNVKAFSTVSVAAVNAIGAGPAVLTTKGNAFGYGA